MTRTAEDVRTSGYLLVALGAVFWALSGTAAKMIFRSGLAPLDLVQVRTTVSSVILLTWLLVRHRDRLRVERRDLRGFLIPGLAMAATQFTYLFAISKIQVAAAILLQYQAPVMIVLWGMTFGRQRPSAATLVAACIAVAGCYLMVGAYRLDLFRVNLEGVIVGLVSAAFFACYSVMSEALTRRYSAWTVLAYALGLSALVWNIVLPPLTAFQRVPSIESWVGIGYICLFGTVLAFGCYTEGIRRIGAARASITATLEPVTAAVLSAVALGELMEALQMAGAVLVLVAIIVLQTRRNS